MATIPFIDRVGTPYRFTKRLTTMQLNITCACNLACNHCHLECGPHREEEMDKATMELALRIFERDGFETLDITGGAIEMHPHFEWLITQAREKGFHVIARTNLAVLALERYAHFMKLYAELGVEISASLPCYTQQNVDAQRGTGVFDADLSVLRELNKLGYGDPESGLTLNLVYNPGGAFLPGDQSSLESDYKKQLGERGIRFNHLFTITNMNLGRFAAQLKAAGQSEEYDELLERNFNEYTLPGMMCREQVSISPDGTLYDCDFNQALRLPIVGKEKLSDYEKQPLSSRKRSIVFADHCYACTAGAGSSCTGAVA